MLTPSPAEILRLLKLGRDHCQRAATLNGQIIRTGNRGIHAKDMDAFDTAINQIEEADKPHVDHPDLDFT